MDGVGAGCLRFAVRLTPPHARLASGRWLGSTASDWLPTRLQRKVSEVIVTSRPPFPSFSLAQYEILTHWFTMYCCHLKAKQMARHRACFSYIYIGSSTA